MTLTAERLRSIVDYNPDTGVFVWKELGLDPRRNKRIAGKAIGTTHHKGYRVVTIDGKRHSLHRLVWLYIHGENAMMDIDHINGDKQDNRISNLRLATDAQNSANARLSSSNKSGFRGVSWHEPSKKWRATITRNRRWRHLGNFDTAEEAGRAYQEEAKRLFGDFCPDYLQ